MAVAKALSQLPPSSRERPVAGGGADTLPERSVRAQSKRHTALCELPESLIFWRFVEEEGLKNALEHAKGPSTRQIKRHLSLCCCCSR